MPAALTRREWLRLSAGALLSLGVWPGRLRGADAPAHDDFTFIAVNDLHALEDACRPWFDDVVRQMKASAPTAEFCLLGGDLADNGTPAQLTLIKDSFSPAFRVTPWWAITITYQTPTGRRMSGFFLNKSTTPLLIGAGKSLAWIPVKEQKRKRPKYQPRLSPGSIKTCPNWTSVALPSCLLISLWATPSSPGHSTPTIYLSAVMD